MASYSSSPGIINTRALPVVNSTQPGDYFIVDTYTGTSIIDFSNIIIGESQVTFDDILTTIKASSACWNESCTVVSDNSASWGFTGEYGPVEWSTTYTTVHANSGIWNSSVTNQTTYGRAYSTGWQSGFGASIVKDGCTLTINHNLGTTDSVMSVWVADDISGTNAMQIHDVTVFQDIDWSPGNTVQGRGYLLVNHDENEVTLVLGDQGYHTIDTSVSKAGQVSGSGRSFNGRFIKVVIQSFNSDNGLFAESDPIFMGKLPAHDGKAESNKLVTTDSSKDISDINTMTLNGSLILGGVARDSWPGFSGNFLNLDDTPNTYTNFDGKYVKVDGTTLIFDDGSAGTFTDLSDTPGNYSGSDKDKYVKVNSSGTGIVFSSTSPETVYTYGNMVQASGYSAPGNGQFDQSQNYTDAYPPTGYIMNDFKAAVASIGTIHYAGIVDGNDSSYCKWDFANSSGHGVSQASADRVRIWALNSEQRTIPHVNYLIVWSQ